MSKQLRLVEEELINPVPQGANIPTRLRFKFYYDDFFFLAYNKGCPEYGDFYKSKPDFHPVYSPSGREVTCTCAYRYNHHKSIMIGHGEVNGVNFFHDNNPTRPNEGDIVLEESTHEITPEYIKLFTTNGWISKKGRRILTEERNIYVTAPQEDAYTIDIVSTVFATQGTVTFGKDGHGYIVIRVADSMDVEDGGTIISSNGGVNEDEINEEQTRRQVDWLDCSGVVAGQKVGIALMRHPSNPPQSWFPLRNYGIFACNITSQEEGYELSQNERLTQRFRILVHEGDSDSIDIARYYQAFVDLRTNS